MPYGQWAYHTAKTCGTASPWRAKIPAACRISGTAGLVFPRGDGPAATQVPQDLPKPIYIAGSKKNNNIAFPSQKIHEDKMKMKMLVFVLILGVAHPHEDPVFAGWWTVPVMTWKLHEGTRSTTLLTGLQDLVRKLKAIEV